MPERAGKHGQRNAALLLLTVGAPLVEWIVLSQWRQKGAMALAPQITALPPLGLFHDLRWVLVYHDAVGAFLWELVILLCARGLLTAGLIIAAWPTTREPPDFRNLLSRVLFFDVVGLVILFPFGLLIFGAAASALSWPWVGGMLPVFVLSFAMYPWVITGRWSRLPTWKSSGFMLLNWLVATLGGCAIAALPLWTGFFWVALCGGFNALAWRTVSHELALTPKPIAFALFAPGSFVVVYGGLIIALHLMFSGAGPSGSQRQDDPPADGTGQPLLLVEGLGTAWTGGAVPAFGPQFQEAVFSYRGLDAHGDPLPYEPRDTRRPLTDLVGVLAQQIETLAQRSGQPLHIVCISEGSLITQIYLATHPQAPVRDVVIASPLLAAGDVYFPPPNRAGWGMVSGIGLRAWVRLFELFGWRRPDRLPVLRSMLEYGPVVFRLERCPMNRAAAVVLMPLSASLVLPLDLSLGLPTYVVGFSHGKILKPGTITPAAKRALLGERPQQSVRMRAVAGIGRGLASAWRVPPLFPGLPAPWRVVTLPGRLDCELERYAARQIFQPRVSHSAYGGDP